MEQHHSPKTFSSAKDPSIFYPSIIAMVILTIPILIWPEESQLLLNELKMNIEDRFGLGYQLLTIIVFIFVMWLSFSRYGKISLGNRDHRFSTFSWASMLFCAGVGTGIIYWGTIEWAYYMLTPPFGIRPESKTAIEYAAAYGIFHWSFIGWSIYSLPAIALGYTYYVKKIPLLRISSACAGLLGKYAEKWPGKVLDLFFMMALLASTGTSLGLGIPMISAGASSLLNVPDSLSLKLALIFLCAIIFSVSVYMGLGKGIKRLSNFNTSAAIILLIIILLTGPTTFILKMGLNSIGLMADNMIRMLTWTDPLGDSRFVEDWTIFYWAWWVAVGPFMGIFITRISKGRTIKEVILGTIFFGSTGATLFYMILGNYALHLQLTEELPILDMVRDGQATQAIIATIGSIGNGKLSLIIFCIISLVFMATSFDSISYTLASSATEQLPADQDPEAWHRLFWAFTITLLPIALIYLGGLESLKLAVLISALPFIFIYGMMGYGLYRDLKKR